MERTEIFEALSGAVRGAANVAFKAPKALALVAILAACDDRREHDKDVGPACAEATDLDSDGDGLTNEFEIYNSGTNPCRNDTDGDRFSDAAELTEGTDPNDASSFPVSERS